MAPSAGPCAVGVCLVAVALLVSSFSTLAPTEMALRYNFVLSTVSPSVEITPGLKFTGPFVRFIRYPRTIQTLSYDSSSKDLLDGRTKDGLPLVLGVAFQYRLLPTGLYELYHQFENHEGDYIRLFGLMGVHTITEVATRFTAYQFFNEKQKIASVMRDELDSRFQKQLFASVESLQINEDDLPDAFTETILMAATSKQNITKMRKTQEAKIIEFQTARIVAEAQANVTVQKAHGDRHRILQNGHADAAIIDAYVEAELQAYGRIHDDLRLGGASLLKYIWYDTLGGGGVAANRNEDQDFQMLIGVNPA
eukprot:CAMPEP_0198538934 /NCGR_PEP_ID=MMETSP1462-20131121/48137_1 /TAXON_ID=1333877 /ORGANISM="Brandtodinium nutriculum, Strain RCC3387" /LENGTH=308 /DNA_ID=CAMNT_0044268969 /DNA_START=60 /DNA_END=982 /DNA_ORIENTATION=+